MDENQGQRIDDKPLHATHVHGWYGAAVIPALWCNGVQPVVADIHDENTGKCVEAKTVVEHIHRKAKDKPDQHQNNGIGFYRKQQQVANVQETERGMEKNNILEYQHLVKQVDEKGNDLKNIESAHRFKPFTVCSTESCSCFRLLLITATYDNRRKSCDSFTRMS